MAIHTWGLIVSALAGLHLALALPSCAITAYGFMDRPLNQVTALSVKPAAFCPASLPLSGYAMRIV